MRDEAPEPQEGQEQGTEYQERVVRYGLLGVVCLIAGMVAYALIDHFSTVSDLAGALVVMALVSLLLAMRSAARRDFGSAVAWIVCALPFAPFLVLLSIPLMRLSTVMGNCDPLIDVCERPAPGAPLPAFLFFVFGILTFAALLAGRRGRRAAA